MNFTQDTLHYLVPRQRLTSGAYSVKANTLDVPIPIGTIMAWAKNLTNPPLTLPDGWVECNGQPISDPSSSLNGKNLPNLNGVGVEPKRFLRGNINSVPPGTGGAEAHTHSLYNNGGTYKATASGAGYSNTGLTGSPISAIPPGASENSNLPPYYEVVWIMKVK